MARQPTLWTILRTRSREFYYQQAPKDTRRCRVLDQILGIQESIMRRWFKIIWDSIVEARMEEARARLRRYL